jgi:hypothetical protein
MVVLLGCSVVDVLHTHRIFNEERKGGPGAVRIIRYGLIDGNFKYQNEADYSFFWTPKDDSVRSVHLPSLGGETISMNFQGQCFYSVGIWIPLAILICLIVFLELRWPVRRVKAQN